MKLFFIILIILTIVAGVAVFWDWEGNIFSGETLRLEILGPSEIILGEETEYIVKYKNNGSFRLEDPELVFEAPEYSLRGGEFFEREVLGFEELGETINPGEEKNFSFKMILLGKEEDVKVAKVSLSYQLKDLKARYESSSSISTQIKSVPLTFEFDLPSNISPNKDFISKLNYFSNMDYLLTDLRCQIEYPSTFEFNGSTPVAIGENEWNLPILNKSEGGRIEVTGNLSGRTGDSRIFRAKLGIWKEGEFILLKEAERTIEIVKSSLYLRQEINGNPQHTALPGEWLRYEIYFKNIGDGNLTNLIMMNKLEGDAFDFQTVESDYGSYQSGDNSIVFDWRQVSKLQHLFPLEEGRVDFRIKLKSNLGDVENPTLRNTIFIGQVEEVFVNKIGSKLEVSQRGFFQDEVFGNSGSIPPMVGQTTTYTMMWQVENYYSNVRNAKVKAVLPENVELTGEIFPTAEASKFAFDSQSREIVWSVGSLRRGSGVTEPGFTLAFQVALTPQSSQRNIPAEIIGQAVLTGEDTWTGTTIQNTSPAVNTNLPNDSTITGSMGIVQ